MVPLETSKDNSWSYADPLRTQTFLHTAPALPKQSATQLPHASKAAFLFLSLPSPFPLIWLLPKLQEHSLPPSQFSSEIRSLFLIEVPEHSEFRTDSSFLLFWRQFRNKSCWKWDYHISVCAWNTWMSVLITCCTWGGGRPVSKNGWWNSLRRQAETTEQSHQSCPLQSPPPDSWERTPDSAGPTCSWGVRGLPSPQNCRNYRSRKLLTSSPANLLL